MDIIAIGVANNSGGGGGGTPTDAYSKTETDALLKNKVGFAEYKDNKISLYDSSSKDEIIGEIDLPVDMVVDQIKTKFSQKFKFDSTTYPDTENPNLDGKPVLVLAIKTSATADTFSFLNMESLVDIYTGGTTKSAIISVDSETGVITNVVRISAETGNKIVQKDDGLFVPNQTAADVSYSNTTSKLKATTTQAAIDETLSVANSKYSKPETGIPSTDMTQAVKDSLGKADTALQAADKTELQDAINDVDEAKLNKTAVLSDFSSSELTNKVPSAQLVLDSFTKKVTTEAVANNTRIVPVPEDVDCFAGIGMIGGKTQKCKNMFDITTWNNTIKSCERGTITPLANGFKITSTSNDAYTQSYSEKYPRVVFAVKPNTAYTLSWNSDVDLDGMVYVFNATSGAVQKYSNNKSTKSVKLTTDSTQTGLCVRFGVEISGNSITYTDIQLEQGTTKTSYEPYHADLWNAPVTEMVVSGVNILDITKPVIKRTAATYSNISVANDTIAITVSGNTAGYVGWSIPVNTGVPYTISADVSNTYEFGYYESDTEQSEIDVSNQRNTWTNKTSKIFSKKYLNLYIYINGNSSVTIRKLKLERGSVPTPYSPYNKTTISLETIINNLPDYGASVSDEIYNYIDFEEDVYSHEVVIVDMGDLSYRNSGSGDGRYITVDNIKTKNSTKQILSSAYASPERTWEEFIATDKSIFVDSNGNILIRDLANTASTLPNVLKGQKLVYPLVTEELIPLPSILPPIHVEPNGTIEFVNEHNLDVPTKTIYKKTI